MKNLKTTLPVALAGSMLLAGQAFGGDAINIVSWGGAWSAAVKGAWTDLYEEETGQAFNFIDYNGGVAEVRAQNEAGNVTWDIVDMIPGDLTIACDEGLMEEIETPDAEDWFDTHPCGIGVVIWATVMAHKDGTYADEKPTMVADFWDFDRFPGKRSMRKVAEVNLEWALIADGVPVATCTSSSAPRKASTAPSPSSMASRNRAYGGRPVPRLRRSWWTARRRSRPPTTGVSTTLR